MEEKIIYVVTVDLLGHRMKIEGGDHPRYKVRHMGTEFIGVFDNAELAMKTCDGLSSVVVKLLEVDRNEETGEPAWSSCKFARGYNSSTVEGQWDSGYTAFGHITGPNGVRHKAEILIKPERMNHVHREL